MELKILRLVFDYSSSGRLVDSKFVDKVIEIVVSSKSINDYVFNVRFTNELEKDSYHVTCASYSFLRREILIDFESIQTILEVSGCYDHLFSAPERIMYRNLIVTQVILHELEHAYQNKQLDNKLGNDIENKLISSCFILEQVIKNPSVLAAIFTGEISMQDFINMVSENRELYHEYYEFKPTERLAQVNSYKTIVSSLEPIKERVPNLYQFEYATLIENLLKNYQKSWDYGSVCPTEVYLSATRQDKVWSSFDFYDPDVIKLQRKVIDRYDLRERLTFGLPIAYDEYSDWNDWLMRTNKYNY